MVDQKQRLFVRKLLKQMALGQITNFEFENAFPVSKDPALPAILSTVRGLSSDSVESKFTKTFARGSDLRKRLCRWMFFLSTDYEYLWPKVRVAPGIRDYYHSHWFFRIIGLEYFIFKSNRKLLMAGDYDVWPFFRREDLYIARKKCGNKN